MKRIWTTMLAATMAIALCTTTALASNLPAQTEQTATTDAITEGTFNDFFPDPNLAKAIANQFNKQVNSQTNQNELNKIYYLYPSNSNIKSIEGIEYLSNLKEIVLNYNNLTKLPDSIGNLSKLEVLYLHENQLKDLPESMVNLSNLRILSVSMNQLETLPDFIGQISSLQFISAAGNQLHSLPDSIGNLPNLTDLYVHYNNLNTLPESFKKLKKLKQLAINNNEFVILPDFLEQFSLDGLFVNNNRLTQLPDFVIARLIQQKNIIPNGINWITTFEQNGKNLKREYENGQLLTKENILPELLLQLNQVSSFATDNIQGTFTISNNITGEQNFDLLDILNDKIDIQQFFSAAGIYNIIVETDPHQDHSKLYNVPNATGHKFTYTIEIVENDSKNVTVITRYLDGALPDETKTYTVTDGAAFLESFDMLDGYEVYNTVLRTMPVFSIDPDAKTVSLSSVDKDYTIELEFDKIEYKVKVATEFPDGKHQNTSKTSWKRHGDTFEQTIVIPDGYTVTNLDQLPADVQVDLVNKTVTIPNIKKDYDIKLILEKQEYQVTVQVVYGDDETKNTTDTYTVAHGDSLTTPFIYDTENYRIKNITFDASGVSVNRSNQVIAIDSVTGNITITISLK